MTEPKEPSEVIANIFMQLLQDNGYAIVHQSELENMRTTLAEDAIYIKQLEERLPWEVIDDPFSWNGFDE